MKKIIITQKRSIIGASKRQKETIKALGLNKINAKVEHNATPQIMGMVEKVRHLIDVENI